MKAWMSLNFGTFATICDDRSKQTSWNEKGWRKRFLETGHKNKSNSGNLLGRSRKTATLSFICSLCWDPEASAEKLWKFRMQLKLFETTISNNYMEGSGSATIK